MTWLLLLLLLLLQVGPAPVDLAWGPGPQHLGACCEEQGGLWLSSKQHLLHKLAGSTLVLQVRWCAGGRVCCTAGRPPLGQFDDHQQLLVLLQYVPIGISKSAEDRHSPLHHCIREPTVPAEATTAAPPRC